MSTYSVCSPPQIEPWPTPLDVDQWTFYVASTTHINAAIGEQKIITLASLRSRVQPLETGFGGLLAAVEDAGRSKRP